MNHSEKSMKIFPIILVQLALSYTIKEDIKVKPISGIYLIIILSVIASGCAVKTHTNYLETQSFQNAKEIDTIEAYEDFLAYYPQGRFADGACVRLETFYSQLTEETNLDIKSSEGTHWKLSVLSTQLKPRLVKEGGVLIYKGKYATGPKLYPKDEYIFLLLEVEAEYRKTINSPIISPIPPPITIESDNFIISDSDATLYKPIGIISNSGMFRKARLMISSGIPPKVKFSPTIVKQTFVYEVGKNAIDFKVMFLDVPAITLNIGRLAKYR